MVDMKFKKTSMENLGHLLLRPNVCMTSRSPITWRKSAPLLVLFYLII